MGKYEESASGEWNDQSHINFSNAQVGEYMNENWLEG